MLASDYCLTPNDEEFEDIKGR